MTIWTHSEGLFASQDIIWCLCTSIFGVMVLNINNVTAVSPSRALHRADDDENGKGAYRQTTAGCKPMERLSSICRIDWGQ